MTAPARPGSGLQAPFPWFGGKRQVAGLAWHALGDVDNYVEPFAGSLAVLLARPARHQRRCETVNDADAYLCNFWRAVAADPAAVAGWADWPVNETDLFARHLWLVRTGRDRLARLEADPEFYDPKVAGWWVWGLNAWIGAGWCAGTGPWTLADDGTGPGPVVRHRDGGSGVARQLPHLGNAGQGINRRIPHLGDLGRGINRHRFGRAGNDTLTGYFTALAGRLRHVRVCCGDWSRVLTRGALDYGGTVGVLLDPPYSSEVSAAGLYAAGHPDDLSTAVRQWAIAHGEDPRLRIILAGYEAEHAGHMPPGWRMHAYTKNRAFGRTGTASGQGNAANRRNERLWFSPGCLDTTPALFDLEAS